VSVTPGKVTSGGALSIASVAPGAGLLPAGTVLRIVGTGFDASTQIAIDGASISSVQFVSSQQLEVTLGAPTEMTAKYLRAIDSAGVRVGYFLAPPSAPSEPPSGFTAVPGVHPILPVTGYTNGVLYDNLVYQARSILDGLVLFNPNPAPVTVVFETVGAANGVLAQTTTVPGSTLYFVNVNSLVNYFPIGGEL
jgi:hypothetical protein